jgi:IS5 family transposase
VIAASTQDRDCATMLFEAALKKYPRLKKFFADGGYQGRDRASAGIARDRKAHGQRRRFQGSASPLGDRADVLVAAPQPPTHGAL